MINGEDTTFFIGEEVSLEEAIPLIVEDVVHVDVVFEGLLWGGYSNLTLKGGVATLSTGVFVGDKVVQFHFER